MSCVGKLELYWYQWDTIHTRPPPPHDHYYESVIEWFHTLTREQQGCYVDEYKEKYWTSDLDQPPDLLLELEHIWWYGKDHGQRRNDTRGSSWATTIPTRPRQ